MNAVVLPWALMSAVGTAVTVSTGLTVVRGPLLGGTAEPVALVALLLGFAVGLALLTLGGSNLLRHAARQ